MLVRNERRRRGRGREGAGGVPQGQAPEDDRAAPPPRARGPGAAGPLHRRGAARPPARDGRGRLDGHRVPLARSAGGGGDPRGPRLRRPGQARPAPLRAAARARAPRPHGVSRLPQRGGVPERGDRAPAGPRGARAPLPYPRAPPHDVRLVRDARAEGRVPADGRQAGRRRAQGHRLSPGPAVPGEPRAATGAGTAADDARWMALALEEARAAAAEGEVPVGAVVVADGRVLARARNRRETDADPTAHAELLALRQAARALCDWHLETATLYVTLEPCFMCAGALVNARLGRLVFGALDPKAGAVGSLANVPADPRLNHRLPVTAGVLAQECGDLLRAFFRSRRGPATQATSPPGA